MKFFSTVAIIGVALLMVSCSTTDDTSSATSPDQGSQGSIAAATSYLVEYSGKSADAKKAVTKAGGTVISELSEISVLLVTGLTSTNATKLGATKGIAMVAPNNRLKYVPSLSELATAAPEVASSTASVSGNPEDAFFYTAGYQWNMAAIDAPGAWTVTQGNGVRVGILDTGGSPDHIDLDGKYDLAACMNFVPSDPNDPGSAVDPSDWQDRHFHGTHVAGTIASNSIGVAAVAPDATLIAVKILSDEGWGDDYWILAGILYASDPNGGNCDIINMSIGGSAPRKDAKPFISLYNKAVNKANSRGCLVVCAAGNEAADMDHAGNYIWLPVEAGTAMGVSATGPVCGENPDQLACYSNYGNSAISVAAPGGNVDCNAGICSVTDLVLSCLSPWVAENIYGFPSGSNNVYLFAAGTSMACPHAVGVAALAEAASGNSNPGWLKTRLQNSADDLGKPGNDPSYGKGRVNANAAVH